MSQEKQTNNMGKVIAKAWADEGYKQRLLSDPKAVLKEEGITVPEGLQVKVVENTDKVFHFVLPPKPASDELSDEDLERAAGGFGIFECGCGNYDACFSECVFDPIVSCLKRGQ